MKVLVLGATGGTGRLIVHDALEKGPSVVALVRPKARAQLPRSGHRRQRKFDPFHECADSARQIAPIPLGGRKNYMLNKTFEQAVTVSKRHCLPSIFLLLLIIGVLQPALATEAPKIPMTASRWQIKGDVAFEQDKAKQDILVIKKGYVQLKHIYFRNGTIEFDVKFVGSRITGLTFHQCGETADALYRVRQQLGQFCLTGFETPNLVLELNAGHTIQNGLNRSIKVPLDAFQLFALTDDVCATLNPQRLRHKYTGVLRLNGI